MLVLACQVFLAAQHLQHTERAAEAQLLARQLLQSTLNLWRAAEPVGNMSGVLHGRGSLPCCQRRFLLHSCPGGPYLTPVLSRLTRFITTRRCFCSGVSGLRLLNVPSAPCKGQQAAQAGSL